MKEVGSHLVCTGITPDSELRGSLLVVLRQSSGIGVKHWPLTKLVESHFNSPQIKK